MISSPARPETGCGADRGEEDTHSFPAEQVAIDYIDEQLERARRSLRRTRAFGVIAVLLILGYMSVVTIAIRNRLLRPQAAAEMAAYYFCRFAAQNGVAQSANACISHPDFQQSRDNIGWESRRFTCEDQLLRKR